MKYIFGFAAAVCFVCSILISAANVGLRERQEANRLLDRQKSVLQAGWLVQPGERLPRARVEELFRNIRAHILDIAEGRVLDMDPETFDEERVQTMPAPVNNAGIRTMPRQVRIFEVVEDDRTAMLVLPIYGQGLWATMYGFLALDADTRTIRGLTYYDHAETPGLGGEVTNPRWKRLWPGRLAYDDEWNVAISVVKGAAANQYEVDGLSGATLTNRGVSNMLRFWLGDDGFGPFLKRFRENKRI